MKIVIEIDTDNDALAGALEGESDAYEHLQEILSDAVRLEEGGSRNLYDYNGNRVGQIVYDED